MNTVSRCFSQFACSGDQWSRPHRTFAGTTSRSYGEKTSATGAAYQDVLEIIRVTVGIVRPWWYQVFHKHSKCNQVPTIQHSSKPSWTRRAPEIRAIYDLPEQGSNEIVESFSDLHQNWRRRCISRSRHRLSLRALRHRPARGASAIRKSGTRALENSSSSNPLLRSLRTPSVISGP